LSERYQKAGVRLVEVAFDDFRRPRRLHQVGTGRSRGATMPRSAVAGRFGNRTDRP
jgi:hypothetical protein